MKVKFLFSVIFAISLTVSAFGQDVPLEAQQPVKGYMLGPGDEIVGKVLGEPQFDFNATVNEDGLIEVPFVDKPLVAKCKTERELRIEVTELLAKYLRSPQLSLRVTERKSRPPVSIYGAVQAPQQVTLTRRANLLELLSFAGGVTEKSGGMVQIFRTRAPMCDEANGDAAWKLDKGGALDVPSRMYSLASLNMGRGEGNPEIIAGDIIVVQKAAPVYVTGEVMKPGEISIPEGGLPLMQAVAMSSGITREAKTKIIKVYRRKTGTPEPQVINVDYDSIRKGTQKDIMLEPFDIVEVGKASKKFSEYLLELVTGIPNRIPIRPF